MDSFPLLIASHPLETFGLLAAAAVTLAVSVWLLVRTLRRPLWDRLRALWHLGAGRWTPLARLRMPAAWQGGPLLLDLVMGFGLVLAAVALFFELADEIGLDTVVAGLARHAKHGVAADWEPAPLLARLAAAGSTFGAWAQNRKQ